MLPLFDPLCPRVPHVRPDGPNTFLSTPLPRLGPVACWEGGARKLGLGYSCLKVSLTDREFVRPTGLISPSPTARLLSNEMG